MKNFFEFFGFLATAGISAVMVFSFIGKKDGRVERDRTISHYSTAAIEGDEAYAEADMTSPRRISGKGAKSNETEYEFTPAGGYGSKKARRNNDAAIETEPEIAPEAKLRNLSADQSFVRSAAKKWKSASHELAEEYNLRPQVLLANAIVLSYVEEGFSRNQLEREAARHGGERLASVANACKKYRYGWTMSRLINDYDLAGYFPDETPVAAASVYSAPAKTTKSATVTTVKSAPAAAKTSPAEEGFKSMVAKEYGFTSWQGLQRLGDHETKAEAQRRVKSLLTAARIR
ncbi:MAG: hypothetical protein IT269_06730 [Saprospiraceae bacterium]|nr:hypothetical protein [Saprospiraceae bacterium]